MLIHQKMFSPQDSPPQNPAHPLKAVPIAVADDEGSDSEEDEFKPRGKLTPQLTAISKPYIVLVDGLV